MAESPELRAAYEELYAAIEKVVRLDEDVEEDESVTTIHDSPEGRVVVRYGIVAAVKSFELVEADSTQYYHINRDADGNSLPHDVAVGLAITGLDWLRGR